MFDICRAVCSLEESRAGVLASILGQELNMALVAIGEGFVALLHHASSNTVVLFVWMHLTDQTCIDRVMIAIVDKV